MSDYALVQSVFVEPKGSTLSAAASVSDAVLYVDDAQDFDDEGGILSLNGAKLTYTSLVEGDNPDDPDEINLAEPLAVAADEDDVISPLSGGLVGEDWYAVVTMGEDGDVAHIPIDVDQRNQWPVGEYPDPVPVIVSDDLQHLEDAPGRTVSSRNAFRNTDEYTYDGIAASIQLPLTKTPISGSEQPFWKAATVAVGGVGLPPGSWRVEMPNLIVDDPDLMAEFEEDDLFWVHYAYDAAADDIVRPVEPAPLVMGTIGDLSARTGSQFGISPYYFVAITDQTGESVTAAEAGTIDLVTLYRRAVSTDSADLYFTTGSISGSNYTVTDVSGPITVSYTTSGDLLQSFPVSMAVNAGDYLGIYGTTSPSSIALSSDDPGNFWRGATSALLPTPTPGHVYALGAVASLAILVQASSS